MRNNAKTCENDQNLQKCDYVNMYIVYLFFKKILKFCEILRNNAIICKILPPATPKGIIRYGVALFLFALFHNISQYISKYFEISFEIFRNNFDFEIFRNNQNISHRSQFFRKISACNFFRKISYINFADDGFHV